MKDYILFLLFIIGVITLYFYEPKVDMSIMNKK